MGKSRGIVFVVSAVVLGACGGGGTKATTGAAGSSGSKTATTITDGGVIDKTIGSALEAGTGQRGKKEDAPGKMRFANYLAKDGKAIDIDVWWGQPDEGQKAVTVKFGEVSPYMSPKRTKDFKIAPYAITEVGNPKVVLFAWDRFEPTKETQVTVGWGYSADGISVLTAGESLTLVESGRDRPEFAAATAGKVKLKWIVVGDAIEVGDDLVRVRTAGKCLTNGTQIADPNDELGNSLSDYSIDTFEVEPGAVLDFGTNCAENSIQTVPAPAKGRALAIAYRDGAGKPALAVVPVSDAP
jgi:hypothetical protein